MTAEQRTAELTADVAEQRGNYEHACQTIAAMHAAAMGEICGPNRGVVEDVADLRARSLAAEEALGIALARVAALEAALVALKIGECWCETGDGNPHAAGCLNAQAAALGVTQDTPGGR
jgi:hypothetical protein